MRRELVSFERMTSRLDPPEEGALAPPEPVPDRGAAPPRGTLAADRRSARWMRSRVRNVHRRPLLVGGVGAGGFVALLVALIVVPRRVQRAADEQAPKPWEWRDTVALAQRLAVADARARQADSALSRARELLLGYAARTAVDTLPPALQARRDSLIAAAADLARLIRRAEDAPLAASYRALGTAPEMRGVAGVAQLLDTLAEVERSRAEFGAAGGVDPIFVALTTRATRIGKAIQDLAEARLAVIRRELDRLTPPVRPPPVSADTLSLARARDSTASVAVSLRAELARARAVNRSLAARAARARAAAAIGASIPAILAASLVFGIALGFGVALGTEIVHPRVADATEAKSVARAPVLITIGAPEPMLERRRRADLEVPPLIDPVSESYRLLYDQLADRAFDLPPTAVTGEAPVVTATVAANLAAASARQVRSTMLLDLDFDRQSMVDVVRLRPAVSLADVLTGSAEWPEAIASVVVGRERTVDVLVSGALDSGAAPDAISAELARILTHLVRRYECVVVSAPLPRRAVLVGVSRVLRGAVVCVRTARTPTARLAQIVAALDASGLPLRGLVVWDREDPVTL